MKWVLAAVLLVVAVTPAAAASPTSAEPRPLAWLSTGDSYSSGEGVRGNVGNCAQSDEAWGPLAAENLRQHGWDIGQIQMSACTGHLAEDFYNARPRARDEPSSLWEWSLEQPGAPGDALYDVITMSFGGNDIGFGEVIEDCLALPLHLLRGEPSPSIESWGLLGGVVSEAVRVRFLPYYDIVPFVGDDCSTERHDLLRRVEALFDPPNDCRPDDPSDIDGYGWRGPRSPYPNYDCAIVIDATNDITGSMVDFWVHVVKRSLTDDGVLVVAGYPELFAASSQWGLGEGLRCHGVTRSSADMLGEIARELDQAYENGVRAANARLGSERVVYVSLVELYDEGGHQLCGTGRTWLNGMVTLTRDRPHFVIVPYSDSSDRFPVEVRWNTIRFRYLGAFHPHADGHRATADLATLHLLGTQPGPDEPTGIPVPSLCGHRPGVLVDGYLPPEFKGDGSQEFPGLDWGEVWLETDIPIVSADFDGDGVEESAAVVRCSATGVGASDTVIAWRSGTETAWQLRPDDIDDGAAGRASDKIWALDVVGAHWLSIEYGVYVGDDPDCCPSRSRRAIVDMTGGAPRSVEFVTTVGVDPAEVCDSGTLDQEVPSALALELIESASTIFWITCYGHYILLEYNPWGADATMIGFINVATDERHPMGWGFGNPSRPCVSDVIDDPDTIAFFADMYGSDCP